MRGEHNESLEAFDEATQPISANNTLELIYRSIRSEALQSKERN